MVGVVSFIIPVFNESTRIECCLNSIQRQERGDLEVEIFTIDGGSTDATLEIIEKWNDANPNISSLGSFPERIKEP